MTPRPYTDLSRFFTGARNTPNGDQIAAEFYEWMEQSA